MKKIIYLALLTFILYGCCDDPVERAKYELSSNEMEILPYELGQKIQFVTSNGYEFAFDVKTAQTEWIEKYPFREFPGCSDSYFSFQETRVILEADYPKISMNLNINSNRENFRESCLNIGINNHFINMEYDKNANFIVNDSNYSDTITVNGKLYKNVYRADFESSEPKPGFSSILYNKEYGIIQIKDTKNETFSIK